MRVFPGLNKVKQDLTNVREYLDIFQKFIELNLNFIDQQNKYRTD